MRTADFLVCPICGVYVGAVIETPKGLFATLNCLTLDQTAVDLPEATPIHYDIESAAERVARRERAWTPIGIFESI